MIQVVILHVQRRLRVVWSSMDSLVALQTQSGRAKSRTGGALELHYCDISRGCSAVSFIGYNKSLMVVILESVGGCVGQWAPVTSVTGYSLKFFRLAAHTTEGFPSQCPCAACVGKPCFFLPASSSPYNSWQGMRWSSILMTFPTHHSWALMSMTSMLVHPAWSRTSRLWYGLASGCQVWNGGHTCENCFIPFVMAKAADWSLLLT